MDEILKSLNVALNYTQELLIVMLMLSRAVPLVVLTPWLGGKLIPPEIKMGVSALLVVLVWPLARISMTGAIPVSPLPFLMLMLKELFIGFAIGFAASHVFYAMEVAGRMIDTVRGSSMAEVMVPQSGERATPFGDIFYQLLIVIFMGLGGHRIFIEAFLWSYKSLPINQGLAFDSAMLPFFEHVVRVTAQILFVGVLISAPIMAATFITDVVFGILNRVAPQLNAYFMSMPVKAMAGIIMVFVAVDPLMDRFKYYTIWSLQSVEMVIRLMVPTG